MKITVISALLVVGLIGGCTPHTPISIEPPAAMPDSFSNVDKAAPTPVNPWWEQFNDPDLNALEEKLLADNPELKQAYARLSQFEAAGRAADSTLFPSLNLTGAASTGQQGSISNNGQSVSLAAGYEIDLWHKLKSTRQATRLEYSASREDIKTLYLTLTSKAAELYFLAIEQEAKVRLTDETIDCLGKTRDQVEFRYRQGLTSSLNLYQAKQNLAAAKSGKPALEAALATTKHALAVLVGKYPNTLQNSLKELPTAPAPPQTGLPATLLQQRPDVKSAFLKVKSSDAKTAAAIADRFPALNLSGSMGTGRTDSGMAITHGNFLNLLAGLTQPIIDNGRRRAEVDRRRAMTAEALARYRQVVLNAFQEVENALIMNQAGEQQLSLKMIEMDAADSALRQAADGYSQGLNDYLTVMSVKCRQLETKRQLLATRRQLLSARISLWRALGGDWLEKSLAANLLSSTTKDNQHGK